MSSMWKIRAVLTRLSGRIDYDSLARTSVGSPAAFAGIRQNETRVGYMCWGNFTC